MTKCSVEICWVGIQRRAGKRIMGRLVYSFSVAVKPITTNLMTWNNTQLLAPRSVALKSWRAHTTIQTFLSLGSPKVKSGSQPGLTRLVDGARGKSSLPISFTLSAKFGSLRLYLWGFRFLVGCQPGPRYSWGSSIFKAIFKATVYGDLLTPGVSLTSFFSASWRKLHF